MARSYVYVWSAKIERETLPVLQAIAEGLGFVIDAPGSYQGKPSAPALLDALATAYQRNPDALLTALRDLGVTGDE